MNTGFPFSRPMYVMLKPAGSLCNLRCKYCYYLEKEKLYADSRQHIISDSLLEKFVKEHFEALDTGCEVYVVKVSNKGAKLTHLTL